jgi:glycosyltransferase involved in cell wall biosynthesis
MRVLHVIPSVGPVRGGPSAAVLAMTKALRAQGVEADIVTTNDNGPGVLNVKTGEFIDHEGARVCFLPRWSPAVGALREFQYSGAFVPWMQSHLASYDGVHVHAVFSYLSTRAMQLAHQAGKRFIVRPLGQLDTWSLKQKAMKKRLYFALAEKKNLHRAAAVHCTSPMEASHVRELLPQARVEVIPHGVTSQPEMPGAAARLREHFSIASDQRVLLFLSRWHPKKNIPLLLQALAKIADESWSLILAGTAEDPQHAAEIFKSVEQLGLKDRVHCPGHVVGDDKALMLAGADIFVLPSVSENFGIAAAEAMVAGLRLVVSEGVDLAPVVRTLQAGSVCATNDEASLVQALREQLNAAPDRERLRAEAGRHFAWESSALKLKHLYAEVFE